MKLTALHSLHIFDNTDAAHPRGIGRYPFVVRGMDVSGDYVYVMHWMSGLKILNIARPANPQRVAECGVTSAATSRVSLCRVTTHLLRKAGGIRKGRSTIPVVCGCSMSRTQLIRDGWAILIFSTG